MRRKIHDRIIQDARSKNLNPVKIEYPKNADWTKWPFENRIRIGNSPFYGIPTNREFHRLLTSRKTSGAEEIWWVIATDRYKPRRIELEWKITSRKQAE
ncbi:MAG: hypothetical protein CMP48_19450 [Rickettsiales bacterium]|nr:hypothetical protein [Rickettsiales bacterium]